MSSINSKKSVQTLSVQSVAEKNSNGESVTTKKGILSYCHNGQELFLKTFLAPDCAVEHTLVNPAFDFLLLAGSMGVDEGRFYEAEYFEHGNTGNVCRGLVQCVNPVTDIQLLLGALVRGGLLPDDFTPYQAHLRDDIDEVYTGSCNMDEDGEATFYYGVDRYSANADTSIFDSVQQYSHLGCCMEFYKDDRLVEIWLDKGDETRSPKVFVCGSDNVNDPEFADKRAEDLDRLEYCLSTAIDILKDYGISYCIIRDSSPEADDDHAIYEFNSSMSIESVHDLCGKILANRKSQS